MLEHRKNCPSLPLMADIDVKLWYWLDIIGRPLFQTRLQDWELYTRLSSQILKQWHFLPVAFERLSFHYRNPPTRARFWQPPVALAPLWEGYCTGNLKHNSKIQQQTRIGNDIHWNFNMKRKRSGYFKLSPMCLYINCIKTLIIGTRNTGVSHIIYRADTILY